MIYTADNESLKCFNLNSLGEFTVIPNVLWYTVASRNYTKDVGYFGVDLIYLAILYGLIVNAYVWMLEQSAFQLKCLSLIKILLFSSTIIIWPNSYGIMILNGLYIMYNNSSKAPEEVAFPSSWSVILS